MNTLAEKLADAWIKKDLIDVKLENIPKNRKDSHLIQQRFHNILKKKTLGWKIGLVTKQLQDEEKLDGPMIGQIIEETVLKNPLKIQYRKVPHCILECEFAFKFLEDTKMLPGVENKKDNFEMYISLELCSPAQNSCPWSRSSNSIAWLLTIEMKSHCVYWDSADLTKCGFWHKKLFAVTS